jgi:hypothetical protein
MTVQREPLARWRYPNRDCLIGDVFPSGRPPFAPFPTVTNLLNANLCPVAIYHDLIHGIDNALIPQYGEEKQRGDLFHKFIAHLKLSLRNRSFELSGYDVPAQLGMIQSLFLDFSQRKGFFVQASSDIWEKYVEPWVRRKLQSKELESISEDDQIIFELSAGNARAPFSLEGGKRHYPLRGRIDEIDLTRKRLIERTIKGTSSDAAPPLLKGYQVWLLWKILCSLEREKLPPQWSPVDFQSFDLVVETPYTDFVIKADNNDYLTNTHSAYAWINDISITEAHGVFQEVFESAACTPITPHPECSHKFLNCFVRNYIYPESRPEIKRIFKPWYRLLLWEKIWEGDLFQYQLLMLNREELVEKGLISEGKIVSFKNSRMELQLGEEKIGSIRGYDRYTIIPYGTLFCGKRETATLVEAERNRLIMELHGVEDTFLENAILLPLSSDSSPPIMQEPPTYLKDQMQRALLGLQHAGVITPTSAGGKSLVQLLEAVFGRTAIRRGSK